MLCWYNWIIFLMKAGASHMLDSGSSSWPWVVIAVRKCLHEFYWNTLVYYKVFFSMFSLKMLQLVLLTLRPLNCQLGGCRLFPKNSLHDVVYANSMFLPCLLVFRAAVWIHPIKAWRCSWWPLANRTCQRSCSDPSPRTRKPHRHTLDSTFCYCFTHCSKVPTTK